MPFIPFKTACRKPQVPRMLPPKKLLPRASAVHIMLKEFLFPKNKNIFGIYGKFRVVVGLSFITNIPKILSITSSLHHFHHFEGPNSSGCHQDGLPKEEHLRKPRKWPRRRWRGWTTITTTKTKQPTKHKHKHKHRHKHKHNEQTNHININIHITRTNPNQTKP